MHPAISKAPIPGNEPVKSYAPGSPERASLKARLVEIAEHVRVSMRHHRLPELAGAHVLAVDHQRHLDCFRGHPCQRRLQAGAFRRSGRIAFHRLVGGNGGFRDRKGHGRLQAGPPL
jgi:hypothetical protein